MYWTSINIFCNRKTLEICKKIRIVYSNSLKLWFSVPGSISINPYFIYFLFVHVLINSLIWRLEIVYWTSINIFCNRKTLEICRTIRIVISNWLKLWFSVPGNNSFIPYFYFFSFMHVLIDSLILKTWNSELDID